MSDISIRPDPACPDTGLFGWDMVYSNETGSADWAYASPDEVSNKGGLSNKAALETAVIIGLFTDRACPPDHPLAKYADGDPRGWWGDGVLDAGETPLGSLLWLLERNVATETSRAYAEVFALDGLQPLIDDGACVKITATATILPMQNGIWLAVALYGRDGAQIYNRKFEMVWRQIAPSSF